MSRGDVTTLLGKPVSAEAAGGDEVLYYRLASSFMDTDGSDTREYWVKLQRGTVQGYGERNDEASRERSRKQYQAAWGALGSIQHTQDVMTPQKMDVNVQGSVQQNVNGTIYLQH